MSGSCRHRAEDGRTVTSMAVFAFCLVLERRFPIVCIDGGRGSYVGWIVGLWRFLHEDVWLLCESGVGIPRDEVGEGGFGYGRG